MDILMEKYVLYIAWFDGDYKCHNDVEQFATFAEAIDEFNYNCAIVSLGSITLIDSANDSIIRQFIRKSDGIVVLK